MNKAFRFFAAISVMVLAVSCTVRYASEKAMQTGREAVRAADSFLDKKTDSKTAAEKIDLLSADMDYLDFSDSDNPDYDIDTKIIELSMCMESVPDSGNDEDGSVLNKRNELAALVGMDKRYKEDTENSTVSEENSESTSAVN